MSNLCILFKKLHGVHIDPRNGTLKDCINKASDYRYWNQLIRCLIQPIEKLPARPETWNRKIQSSRNQTWENNAPPPTPPPRRRKEPPTPSPQPGTYNRVPPPIRESKYNNTNREYIDDNVGKIMYDLLKVLGLVFGASETEVKVQF